VLGARRLRQLECALQPQLELAPVREPRERVVARVVGELLRELVRGRDVGERALVEQHVAVGVAHGPRVLEHHDLRTVAPLEQELGVADLAVLLHGPLPVLAVVGVHVDVARDVELEQFVLGLVAQHAHERGVRRHELAVGRGLEHAGRDVLEQLAVALLGGLQREQRVRALRGVAQHALDELRRELLAAEEVERTALYGLVAELFLVLADEHHDGHVGRLGLDPQEGRQPGAVGQGKVEQHRVDPPVLEPGDPVRERGRDLEPVGLAANGRDGAGHAGLVAGLGTHEQDVGGGHRRGSIRPCRHLEL
jgi:hypothetical protein